MKKLIKTISTAAALLTLTALLAGSAGTADNPFISRSYLEGEYKTALKEELDTHITSGFNSVYDTILSGRPLVPTDSGYTYSQGFRAVKLYPEQTLLLSQGTGFIVQSGGAAATVTSGVLLDLSDASGITGSMRPATERRYLLPEDSTAALVTGGEEIVTLLVDGHYRYDGEGRRHYLAFTDVALDSWYCSAVDFVFTNNLFRGTSDNEFSPTLAMTRGMFVTVLYRLSGESGVITENAASFGDVADAQQYYYEPVMWASSNGIVLGYDDGTFKPNVSITREQMATIMCRYAAWRGEDVSAEPAAIESFPDAGEIQDYAREAMCWAVSRSIINGSDGQLLPLDTAQRSHVAQIILNYMKNA